MEQPVTAIFSAASHDASGLSALPAENGTSQVLIVDDDPVFRYLCVSLLESAGEGHFSSVEAGSIEEALAAMNSHEFSCVLMDYRLPDGTGVDLIKMIGKEHPDWIGPLILMTADGSEDIVADGMRAGAEDYISKRNITAPSLSRLLERAFEKASLKQELRKQNIELTNTNLLLRNRTAEITDFYHKISHEIKTPLTAARMFMSMLDEGLAGSLNEEQVEIVSQAIESCDELTKHFNDLIECTRLETGKIKLTYSDELLHRLITRSVASLLTIAEDKEIELKINCDTNLPVIQVDAGRIVQVLANLIGNAIKFTEPKGTIEIGAQPSSEVEGLIEISVTDTGIGIEAELIPNIFERLYQVSSCGDAITGAGLGLGLSITKEIVELHGGSIDVTSNYGVGSEFTVKLPISRVKEKIIGVTL